MNNSVNQELSDHTKNVISENKEKNIFVLYNYLDDSDDNVNL